MKYVCELCGMVYDEAAGDRKHGIAPDTLFAALPADFECPGCGSGKEAFCPRELPRRQGGVRQDDRAFWENVKCSDESPVSQR